jgi:ribosomal protein S10
MIIDTKMKLFLDKFVNDVFKYDNEYGYGDISDDTNLIMKSLGLSTTLMKNQIYSTWNQIFTTMKNKKMLIDSIDDIFTSQAHKIDVFSLGMTLLLYLYKQNQFVAQLVRYKKYKNELSCLKGIIQRCLTFNMFERMTLTEFINEYTKYLEMLLQGHNKLNQKPQKFKASISNHDEKKENDSYQQKHIHLKHRPSVSKVLTDCIVEYSEEDLKKIGHSEGIPVSKNKKETCKRLIHVLSKNQNKKFNYSMNSILNKLSMIDVCMTKHTVKELRRIAKANNVKLKSSVRRKKDICQALITNNLVSELIVNK